MPRAILIKSNARVLKGSLLLQADLVATLKHVDNYWVAERGNGERSYEKWGEKSVPFC
jgi:hypothetical protein